MDLPIYCAMHSEAGERGNWKGGEVEGVVVNRACMGKERVEDRSR